MSHISKANQEVECTYREIPKLKALSSILENSIRFHNESHKGSRIDLAMFDLAIDMVCKINRAI